MQMVSNGLSSQWSRPAHLKSGTSSSVGQIFSISVCTGNFWMQLSCSKPSADAQVSLR